MRINLNSLIPSKYNALVYDFLNDCNYNTFAMYGGRGSVKSTVGALLLVLTILNKGCAVAIRRYGNSLKNSIYQEVKTAIERLNLDDYFSYKVSPLEITCKLTGFTCYFRGLDDPQKIKSLKASKGQFRCLLFEECQEIEDEAKTRSVIQTIGRGADKCNIIYIFNPPNAKSHWTNQTLRETTPYLYSLWVNYTDVPRQWLGEQFYQEAERLKSIDEDLYNFEYGGVVGSNKGLVFKNIHEFKGKKSDFTTLFRGLDFGLATNGDPSSYVVCAFNQANKELYIVDEWYQRDTTYPKIAEAIKAENVHNFKVFCDSADSGGIKQLRIEGISRAMPCKKGKVQNGITWLRGLNGIYIDPIKCPNTYREFTEYSWVLQKNTGDFVLDEKGNHSIDAVRYALSDFIKY